MPCRDYYDDHPEQYFGPKLKSVTKELERAKRQISFAESALCATLKALSKTDDAKAFDMIDFAEAGITREALFAWWKKHLELDKKHRLEEERRHRAAEALKAKK